jgi:peptidoglycan/LPS O-acetylase OafA/YrhL
MNQPISTEAEAAAHHRLSSSMHVGCLDSVRGLAALSVLFEHYVISFELPTRDPFWSKAWDYSPLHIVWDGAAAVSLFFVLSGLVLSLKHFRITQQPDLSQFDLLGYFISRCFRLGPPYLATLALSALGYMLTTGQQPLLPLQRHSAWLDELWGHPVGVWGVLAEANLFAMPEMIVMVPQAWTLAIELLLSLLIPLGVLLAGRSSLWLLAFTGVSIQLLGAPPVLFHFMLGVLMAKYYRDAAEWLAARRLIRRLTLSAGIVLYTAADTFAGHLNGDWPSTLAGIGAGLILLFVMGSSRAQTMLSLPLLRFIGKVSFSLYLLHMLVLLCAMPWLWQWLHMSPMDSVAVWWAGLLCCTALTDRKSVV